MAKSMASKFFKSHSTWNSKKSYIFDAVVRLNVLKTASELVWEASNAFLCVFLSFSRHLFLSLFPFLSLSFSLHTKFKQTLNLPAEHLMGFSPHE